MIEWCGNKINKIKKIEIKNVKKIKFNNVVCKGS